MLSTLLLLEQPASDSTILQIQQSNQCFSDDESFHFGTLYRTILSKMRDKEIDTSTKSSLYCITKGLN